MKKTTKKTRKKDPRDNLVDWYFTKDIQPSPEAKKAWRERKRQARKMMDMVLKYQSMTTGELKEHMEKNKDNLTVLEYIMMKYVIEGMNDKKIMLDMLDRHISKAPQEITGAEGDALFSTITIKKHGASSDANW